MSEKSTKKEPPNGYEFDAVNGEITRQGKIIAIYDDSTGKVDILSEKFKRFRLPIAKTLGAFDIKAKSYDVTTDADVHPDDEPDDHIPEVSKKVKPSSDEPPMPKMNPRFGDKTPAIVEWYRKYRVEEYKVRYKITQMDADIPQFDYETGEETGTIRRDIGKRKTHLSIVPESYDGDDDDDWGSDN